MDMVPRLLGYPLERGEAADPGVDVEYVDPAVGSLDLTHYPLGSQRIGDIGGVSGRPGNCTHGGTDRVLVAPGEVDLGTLCRKGLGGGEPHPGVATEDEDDLLFKPHLTLHQNTESGFCRAGSTSCITSQCSAIRPFSTRKMSITANPGSPAWRITW